LAAELESNLDETSHLVQSHGGIFEVERDGQLIFSKKTAGRFPMDGEVLQIIHGLDTGMPLEQAQIEAGRGAPHPPSFMEWLSKLWKKKSPV
jgi:selT/selW/selH-like putative selenoprotein